jgi:hypothetical protein
MLHAANPCPSRYRNPCWATTLLAGRVDALRPEVTRMRVGQPASRGGNTYEGPGRIEMIAPLCSVRPVPLTEEEGKGSDDSDENGNRRGPDGAGNHFLRQSAQFERPRRQDDSHECVWRGVHRHGSRRPQVLHGCHGRCHILRRWRVRQQRIFVQSALRWVGQRRLQVHAGRYVQRGLTPSDTQTR